MARNLLKAGFQLTVYDAVPAAVEIIKAHKSGYVIGRYKNADGYHDAATGQRRCVHQGRWFVC